MTEPVGNSKKRGWLLLFLGLFLVGFMGWIMLNTLPSVLLAEQQAADGTTYTGTAEQAQSILLLFSLVIAVGLMSIVYGIYMIVTGRQNKIFMALSLLLAGILVIVAYTTTRSLKAAQEPPPQRIDKPVSAPG